MDNEAFILGLTFTEFEDLALKQGVDLLADFLRKLSVNFLFHFAPLS